MGASTSRCQRTPWAASWAPPGALQHRRRARRTGSGHGMLRAGPPPAGPKAHAGPLSPPVPPRRHLPIQRALLPGRRRAKMRVYNLEQRTPACARASSHWCLEHACLYSLLQPPTATLESRATPRSRLSLRSRQRCTLVCPPWPWLPADLSWLMVTSVGHCGSGVQCLVLDGRSSCTSRPLRAVRRKTTRHERTRAPFRARPGFKESSRLDRGEAAAVQVRRKHITTEGQALGFLNDLHSTALWAGGPMGQTGGAAEGRALATHGPAAQPQPQPCKAMQCTGHTSRIDGTAGYSAP